MLSSVFLVSFVGCNYGLLLNSFTNRRFPRYLHSKLNIMNDKREVQRYIFPFDSTNNDPSFKKMKILLLTSIAPFFISFYGLAAVADSAPIDPSTQDIQTVQMAFRDYDSKRLEDAEKEFSISIKKWIELDRSRDEIVSLYKARANVRLDFKKFDESISDYNDAIRLMSTDGEKEDGTARYPEYPDTFAGRALAYEGLADWNAALSDYNKAIGLWGGGRGEGINPFVLTFRGNTLCKLGRFSEAILDYEAASNSFNVMRDIARYSDAKANLALALYQIGNIEDSVKAMKDVIRKNPGYADMHVAIAADAWSKGDYINALNEWRFACDKIDVGCEAYKDISWLSTVRRWPPSLVDNLSLFLNRQIPPKLLNDQSGIRLAPATAILGK